jgi:hypothetical protein
MSEFCKSCAFCVPDLIWSQELRRREFKCTYKDATCWPGHEACKDFRVPSFKDAYYSAESARRVGCAFYPDKSGVEVAVSEVVDVGRKPVSRWPDLVFVGQVRNVCVRSVPLEHDDGPFCGPEEDDYPEEEGENDDDG